MGQQVVAVVQPVVAVNLQEEQVEEVAQQVVQAADLGVEHQGEVLEVEHARQVLEDREVGQEVQVGLEAVALVALEEEVEEEVEGVEEGVISG